jgi:hypothetical protein
MGDWIPWIGVYQALSDLDDNITAIISPLQLTSGTLALARQ